MMGTMPFQRVSRPFSKSPQAPSAASRRERPPFAVPEPGPEGAQAATEGFWSEWMDRASRFGHNLANPAADAAPVQAKPAENRTGLPDNLKAGIESLSGLSLDDVKVHYGSEKPAQLQAQAYTQGTQIHVAPGKEEHLAHEAWHVVQQKQGRVKPTMQMKQARINDDAGLEKEADVMGERALTQPPRKAGPGERSAGAAAGGRIVQRKLTGAYAEAGRVLASAGPGRAEPVASGMSPQVVQRVLSGKYQEAAQKIAAYMPDSYAERSQILQEAQDAGYPAPNLPGHMSQSSGKDDAGEAERQRQINAVWAEWLEGFNKHKASQAPEEEDVPKPKARASAAPKAKKTDKSKVFVGAKREQVAKAKEEKKESRKAAKKGVYEEYLASLGGGKPSVKGFAAWKKANGYT